MEQEKMLMGRSSHKGVIWGNSGVGRIDSKKAGKRIGG